VKEQRAARRAWIRWPRFDRCEVAALTRQPLAGFRRRIRHSRRRRGQFRAGGVKPGMSNRTLQMCLHAARAGAVAGLLLMIGAPTAAQRRTPGFERRNDDPRTRTIALLQSADPVQQAWGAWFSGRDVQPEMIPLLQQVVSRRIAGAAMADIAAADIALDALIQLNATVPADVVLLVHERRPAQALVLLSKGGEDAADALITLMRQEKGLPWFKPQISRSR
jgi:hypothetical protein